MRAVVAGYGSIGRRHARLLAEIGCDVAVASRREVDAAPRFDDLAAALTEHAPGLVVIATETARHRHDLQTLADAGFRGTTLVEKPLVGRSNPLPTSDGPVFVAYNLRFHPLLQRLRALVMEREAVSAEIHVGQHLADWRPGRDYRSVYSSRRDLGGGVLRDLSHELDYARWLFGDWTRLTALGGRTGLLDGDAEDRYAVLMSCARCPVVTVSLNTVERPANRFIQVNTSRGTLRLDFIAATLTVDGGAPEPAALERDATYREQLRAVISGDTSLLCSAEQGLAVVETIEAAERAAAEERWIQR